MRRELFEDFVRAPVAIRSWKSRTMPISIGVHGLLIAGVILMAVLGSDMLPAVPVMLAFVAPVAQSGPPPAAAAAPAEPPLQRASAKSVSVTVPEAAPVDAPAGIKPDSGIVRDPEPTSPSGVEGGVPGGGTGAVVTGLSEPPPPPAPAPAPPSAPMRLGSGVKPPTKLKDVSPVYPYVAQAARVGGQVIIEAVVGPDGRVTDARILRSIALLDRAALDAVSQWVYTPTFFNGVPVAVILTVTVTFVMR